MPDKVTQKLKRKRKFTVRARFPEIAPTPEVTPDYDDILRQMLGFDYLTSCHTTEAARERFAAIAGDDELWNAVDQVATMRLCETEEIATYRRRRRKVH